MDGRLDGVTLRFGAKEARPNGTGLFHTSLREKYFSRRTRRREK